MDTPKRKPGRPRKLPKDGRHTVRCTVLEDELPLLRAALKKTGLSQLEFTRAVVLWAAGQVSRGEIPEFLRAVIDKGDSAR